MGLTTQENGLREEKMGKDGTARADARREEIIDACEKLYKTQSFKEITLKDIGRETTFTRTSLYNYFSTREEIFLALFQREYTRWGDELEEIYRREALDKESFAAALARSLSRRENMLKLTSMNLFDIEENSSLERLTEFKKCYGRSMRLVRACLKKFFPAMSEEKEDVFVFGFYPFLFGLYPYAHATEKQIAAMDKAGAEYPKKSIYELAEKTVLALL